MRPVFFDFANQETLGDAVTAGGPDQRAILPEDVGATLMASAGLRYQEYRGAHPLWRILDADPY